ncbi:MAG: glycosyltransferase family 2 protein [Candidatus Saelkia tenebricola]|nr:glycosyltransferase family 2 protein [Candidatus Saelkia tenebricola]
MKLSVIIPAYNEEGNIPELIKKIKEVLSGYEKEIILVDDGSTDNSFKVALDMGIKVIKHPYNIGNGAAVKTGIRAASLDTIVLLDADLQHPPEEILFLLKEAESYDMIVGSRTKRSFGRRDIANRVFNAIASYVTGRKILDLTSGFRVVKTEICKSFLYLLPNRFSYPTTLTLAFLKSGRSVKFIPVEINSRIKGKSKISPFKDGMRFMLIIAKIATIYSPFKIFLPVSLFFFLTGVFYYLYTYISAHRFTNMGLLLITTSVIIFMLSLIAEQVAQLHIKESE